ncbi:MAG TPA: hypothetical protein VKY74_24790 [Chloroflexia bacterium]|nr:hypothetical protein [Chloroflexia bacterium]
MRTLDTRRVRTGGRGVLLCVLGLLLAGLWNWGAPLPAAAAPDPRLAGLALYPTPSHVGPPRTTFSTSTDNVLCIGMRWHGLVGAHTAHLTLVSPDGAIYQVLDVPFTARSATEEQWVWGVLPIAGTWMSRLLGVWHLTVTLDDSPAVLGQTEWMLTQ